MATVRPDVNTIQERLRKLGLPADELPLDRFSSAISALCCFPVYMVATLPEWSDDKQAESRRHDVLGIGSLRDAFAAGREESHFEISSEHREVLHSLLSRTRPTDRIVYEYALETLELLLEQAAADFAEAIKAAVARGLLAVSQASGQGWFGAGSEATRLQRACIDEIVFKLKLNHSPTAVAILEELDA